jgi:hypothetical protein
LTRGDNREETAVSEPLIFINHYTLMDGKFEDYEKMVQESVDFVEGKEPDMLHFASYANEDRTEATTFQVHRNAENMAYHMELMASRVQDASEIWDFSTMRMEIYGTPTEAILERLSQLAGTGLTVTIEGPVTGFNRFD